MKCSFPHEDPDLNRHVRISIGLEKVVEDMDKKSTLEENTIDDIDKIFTLSLERLAYLAKEYNESTDIHQKDFIANLSFVDQLNIRNNISKKLLLADGGQFSLPGTSFGRIKESIQQLSTKYKTENNEVSSSWEHLLSFFGNFPNSINKTDNSSHMNNIVHPSSLFHHHQNSAMNHDSTFLKFEGTDLVSNHMGYSRDTNLYSNIDGERKAPKIEDLQPLTKATNNSFVTAKQQFISNTFKRQDENSNIQSRKEYKRAPGSRLGINRSIPQNSRSANEEDGMDTGSVNLSLYSLNHNPISSKPKPATKTQDDIPFCGDEKLKNIDPKMIQFVMNEIMDIGSPVTWDDISGLEHAKATIKEIVVWPMLRPDIFTGLRGPPKGILLFGPPGTGKTLIGKCIASQSGATFFNISASSLTSKWIGDGEKMVRALFAVARCHSPAVIFVDEIDSLLTARTEGEVEATRRLKTEFLIQLDGAATSDSQDCRLLLIGATNRPQELDEAARRRLVKRLLIPLPDAPARADIVKRLLLTQSTDLNPADYQTVANWTDGYSGSDMHSLCREASLGPIRSIPDIRSILADQVRPIALNDFEYALTQVRASVSEKDLGMYENWNKMYGSMG